MIDGESQCVLSQKAKTWHPLCYVAISEKVFTCHTRHCDSVLNMKILDIKVTSYNIKISECDIM